MDYSMLSEHGMFEYYRNKFKRKRVNMSNLIAIEEEMLYLWVEEEGVLLTLQIRKRPDNTFSDFQILKSDDGNRPHNVTEITLDPSGLYIATVSRFGVCIMSLPQRWGSEMKFLGGEHKEINVKWILIAPTVILAISPYKRFKEQPSVSKVRWCPGNALTLYIAILYSDNCLRLYDVVSLEMKKFIQVGSIPRPNAIGMPDLAVDFDFSPNIMKHVSNVDDKATQVTIYKMQWIIYILKSSGDVCTCTVDINLYNDQIFSKMSDPITMYPQERNNYGTDAASLLVLNCNPPLIVIASENGKLYHCLHIVTKKEDEPIKSSESSLFVFEILQIDLGLNIDKKLPNDLEFPLYLKIDSTSTSRYMCSHDAGVHLVRLPIITPLTEFSTVNDDTGTDLQTIFAKNPSIIEYCVCTQLKGQTQGLPLQGLHTLAAPNTIVVLLGNGELVTSPIRELELYTDISKLMSNLAVEENDEGLNTYVSSEIKTNPLLKATVDHPTRSVLETVIDLLKSDMCLAQRKVMIDQIQQQAFSLRKKKEMILDKSDKFGIEKEIFISKAEELAEKYEEINDKQTELKNRARVLLLKAQGLDIESAIDRKLQEKVQEKALILNSLITNDIVKIHERMNYFKMQANYIELIKNSATFDNNQMKSIKNALSEMKGVIAHLVDRVKILKTIIELDTEEANSEASSL